MRQFLHLAAGLICLLGSTKLAAQNLENPVEYMNFISKQQENISKKFMSYTSAAAHGKRAKKVESLRSKLLDEVQESRMNISGMGSFKGDKEYRDTAVNFMKLYFNVLNEDYSKIINMEEIAEQSYDGMEAYMLAQEMVDRKLEEGNTRMKEASARFAAKNNVNLVDGKSELGDMMKQVSLMNKHYHDVYLIFFKPFKQEAYLMEAIEKGNITGIEQNKSSLLKYAQDGLEKLKDLKGFQGDMSIVNTAKAMLNFYIKEVEKSNSVSDYFLTKERFESIKKEYEKKGSPAKADVDAYNKAVGDINKASQAYNNNNQLLNQLRKDALENWNNSVNAFLDNHTPHYK
ncbi:MAG: hypothetical protein JWQ27_2118 [Ferruginibacter sp.]|nr:hypothetical protein [Ferruginibacter sp.]